MSMRGWSRGFVWLNGFNLGRFWNIGPQFSLYVPANVLRKGNNTIVIFETGAPKPDFTVNFRATPDYNH